MIIEFGVDMKSINLFSKKVLFFLLISFYQTVFSGLVKDTFVRIGVEFSDIKKVQELKVGDTVLSFRQNSNDELEFINIPIKAISVEKQSNDLQKSKLVWINIVSDNGEESQLLVGSNTELHNPKTSKWIGASNLSLEDKLLDVNLNTISINKISIEEQYSDIEIYELSLEEPHYYFVCDSNGKSFLIHNMVYVYQLADKAGPYFDKFANSDMSRKSLELGASLYVAANAIYNNENPHLRDTNPYDRACSGHGYRPKDLRAWDKMQQEKSQSNNKHSKKDISKNLDKIAFVQELFNEPDSQKLFNKFNKGPKPPKPPKNPENKKPYCPPITKNDPKKFNSKNNINTHPAPKNGNPETKYFKQNNNNRGSIESVTKYGECGKPLYRSDYSLQGKGQPNHTVKLGKGDKIDFGSHKHDFKYDNYGRQSEIVKGIESVGDFCKVLVK